MVSFLRIPSGLTWLLLEIEIDQGPFVPSSVPYSTVYYKYF
jgi:hypothetical protein